MSVQEERAKRHVLYDTSIFPGYHSVKRTQWFFQHLSNNLCYICYHGLTIWPSVLYMTAHVKLVQCWQLIFFMHTRICQISATQYVDASHELVLGQIQYQLTFIETRGSSVKWSHLYRNWWDQVTLKAIKWLQVDRIGQRMVYLGSTLGSWHFHLEKDSVQTRNLNLPLIDFWLKDKDNSVMQLFLSGHHVFKDKYREKKITTLLTLTKQSGLLIQQHQTGNIKIQIESGTHFGRADCRIALPALYLWLESDP